MSYKKLFVLGFTIIVLNVFIKPPVGLAHDFPFALHQNIIVEDMEPKTSEAGFSVARHQDIARDSSLTLYNLPFWYRKNISRYIDLGLCGTISLTNPMVSLGSELIIGKKPIKIAAGIYPILLTTQHMEAAIGRLKLPGKHKPLIKYRFAGTGIVIGIWNWWQMNLIFGGGSKHLNFYGGVRTSRLAIGPLSGLSFDLKDEWTARCEGSVLFKPPWEDPEEVKGTSFSLGLAIVKTFGEFEY